MVRFFEMNNDRQTAWRAIRSTRSSLPTGMPSSRRTLYASALEQAEQQYRAAETVGYESRPLNLFYGLSQAGRAIAAARTPDGRGVSPEVTGHGLKVVGLSGLSTQADIFGLEVLGEGGRDTSFGRLAWLLGSDDLKRSGVTLAEVWMMLLEVSLDFPLDGYGQTKLVQADGEFIRLAVPEDDEDATSLRALYPQLGRAVLTEGVYGYSDVRPDGTRAPERRLCLPTARDQLSNYRGSPALMPAFGESDGHLDPLLSWWVMLYGLSMLARYRPVEWTKAINVDRSPRAVWLELLLEKALDAVPHQIQIALTAAAPRGLA